MRRGDADDIKESGLVAPIVGHVGDGNFHVAPFIDLDNATEIEAADAFAPPPRASRHRHGRDMHRQAWGRPEEREYMEEEHGAAAIDLMRRVKAWFDPENLFNPGKVFYA